MFDILSVREPHGDQSLIGEGKYYFTIFIQK